MADPEGGYAGMSLGAAWAECESALPPKWVIRELAQLPAGNLWFASAALPRTSESPPEFREGFGASPEAALRSLAGSLVRQSGRLEPAARREPGPLDAAWQEAQAALPPGWTIRELYRLRADIWAVSATLVGSMEQPGDHAEAMGATAGDALKGLAVELRMKRQQ